MYKIFYTEVTGMFMASLYTKYHTPVSHDALRVTIKPKAK